MSRHASILSLLISFLLLPWSVCADNTTTTLHNSSAVFVYNSSRTDQFVFAMNAVAETGDVYFHMSAPAGNAWMAVGFGDQMAGSFMLVVYPSANGSSLTISPRVAMHGESEPTYYPHSTCDYVNNLAIDPNANNITTTGSEGLGGNMYADAVCHNATSWMGPNAGQKYALDFTNKNQSFIWAVGPGESINSDALDAPMNRHSYYGQFTMDMVAATTASGTLGSVPGANGPFGSYVLQSASANFNGKKDNNGAQIVHALVMCAAFILIFPSGALLLRLFNRVWLHTAVQGIGFVFSLIGFACGCAMTPQYNRSRNFNSAHQIIGLLVCLALCVQFGVGLFGHIRFKRGAAIPALNKIHLVLGPLAMFFGLVAGGLGINLALNNPFLQYYIIVTIVLWLAFGVIRVSVYFCSGRREKRKQAQQDAELLAAGAGYASYAQMQADRGPQAAEYPLTTFQSPPAYDAAMQQHQQQQQQDYAYQQQWAQQQQWQQQQQQAAGFPPNYGQQVPAPYGHHQAGYVETINVQPK